MAMLLGVLVVMVMLPLCDGLYLDMTYDQHVGVPRWPNYQPFRLDYIYAAPFNNGTVPWVAYNNFLTPEHLGTHTDSPYHFYEKGWKIHEIPFENLHGPAVVIDITKRVSDWANTTKDVPVFVKDVEDWEKKHGKIPDGAYILMYSGWGVYWNDPEQFIGGKNASDLHYPGFGAEAAKWLITNRPTIKGIGVDTLSCDVGKTNLYEVHVLIQTKNILCVENIKNMDKIPSNGAELFVLPMKIRNGTGAPSRVYATWTDHEDDTSASHIYQASVFFLLLSTLYFLLF